MDLFSKEFLKCLCCCLDSIVVSFWFLLQCTVHMSVTHSEEECLLSSHWTKFKKFLK